MMVLSQTGKSVKLGPRTGTCDENALVRIYICSLLCTLKLKGLDIFRFMSVFRASEDNFGLTVSVLRMLQ